MSRRLDLPGSEAPAIPFNLLNPIQRMTSRRINNTALSAKMNIDVEDMSLLISLCVAARQTRSYELPQSQQLAVRLEKPRIGQFDGSFLARNTVNVYNITIIFSLIRFFT